MMITIDKAKLTVYMVEWCGNTKVPLLTEKQIDSLAVMLVDAAEDSIYDAVNDYAYDIQEAEHVHNT